MREAEITQAEQQAVARTLHSLVLEADRAAPLQLPWAERIEQRHRRRRVRRGWISVAGLLVVWAGGLLGSAVSRHEVSSPAAVSSAPGDKTIQDARFVAPVSFDKGALTISPASGAPPGVTENDAIRMFRSTGMMRQLISDVQVGYGLVTVAPAVKRGAATANLTSHPAWVVIYQPGWHSCPMMSAAPTTRPEGAGRRVFILDAVESADGYVYQEAGSWCGRPMANSLAVATQYVSLPWTVLRRNGTAVTVQYQLPGCPGPAGPGVMISGPRTVDNAVTVIVGRAMLALGCPAGASSTAQVQVGLSDSTLTHDPTGPISGLYTDVGSNGGGPDRFDYDDGR